MQKPTLREFQANTKAKSADVNYNFEELSDYVYGSADELKTFVQTQIANMNLALNNTVFTGKIEIYSGSADSIPTGYLLCNGQEVSRETYSNLFDVIGTTYGEGNGVNTFNVPDYSDVKFITSKNVAIAGNGMAIGLTNGSSNFGLANTYTADSSNYSKCLGVYSGSYGANSGVTPAGYKYNSIITMGLSQDPEKSGITGELTTSEQTPLFIIKT